GPTRAGSRQRACIQKFRRVNRRKQGPPKLAGARSKQLQEVTPSSIPQVSSHTPHVVGHLALMCGLPYRSAARALMAGSSSGLHKSLGHVTRLNQCVDASPAQLGAVPTKAVVE